jgi:recombination protein RecA
MTASKKSGKTSFSRSKKKKDEDELTLAEIGGGDPIDFGELVGTLQEIKDCSTDIFIPDEEHKSLIEVNDWIPMPEPFCEVMGTPGLPCGHIVEALGKPDSGKTTFCTHALIGAQQAGGIAVLIDTEHKFDFDRAEYMGLDRNKIVVAKAETIEEVFFRYVSMMKAIREHPKWSDRKVVMAWDSLGSTPCEDELNPETKDHNMRAAHAITAGLRKTRYFLRKMNAAFLIINQVYTKQTTTPWQKKTRGRGGMSPEYFSSLRLEFTPMGKITKSAKDPKTKKPIRKKIGITSRVEVVKNHMAPPFQTAQIEIDKKGVVFGGRKAE